MIINRDHPYVEYLNRIETLLPSDKDFYYFDFNNPNYTQIQEILPTLDKSLNFVLDSSMEGFRSIISDIYRVFVTNNSISEEKIYLISGAADICEHVKEVATRLDRKPFTAIWSREFELMMSVQLYYQMMKNKESLLQIHNKTEKKGFIKSFINLNRRWRMHRPVLVGMLAKRDLLPRGYISLTKADHPVDWNYTIDSILSTHKNDPEIYDYFLNHSDYLHSLTPLTIDRPTLEMFGTFNLTEELDYFYANSYFSVVTETNYYYNREKYNNSYVSICEATKFISEKTFKPMIYQHPFIIVSVPNMLDLLRELGYKTFHPYINETYDTIIDDGQRMIAIVDEIERLSRLNEKQLQKFLKNTQDIVVHNFNLLQEQYKILFGGVTP